MEDMTDEEMQALIMGGGAIAQEDAKIAKLSKMAALLRAATPGIEGQHAGRVYRAASPLTAIANIAGNAMQAKNIGEQGVAEAAKAGAMTRQNSAVMAALIRMRKPKKRPGLAGETPLSSADDEGYAYDSPL